MAGRDQIQQNWKFWTLKSPAGCRFTVWSGVVYATRRSVGAESSTKGVGNTYHSAEGVRNGVVGDHGRSVGVACGAGGGRYSIRDRNGNGRERITRGPESSIEIPTESWAWAPRVGHSEISRNHKLAYSLRYSLDEYLLGCGFLCERRPEGDVGSLVEWEMNPPTTPPFLQLRKHH